MRTDGVLRGRRTSVALLLCTAMALTSCSSEKKEADGVPAAKLCDSSLTSDAADALEKISSDDRYRETVLSLDKAAVRLRDNGDTSTSRSTVCTVYTRKEGTEVRLFQIEFVRPDAGAEWPPELDPEDSYYSSGIYAESSNDDAFIAFPCTAGLRKHGPPVVAGVLVPDSGNVAQKLPNAERSHAYMVMLHSASRALAGKLGCLAEARLPVKLPEASPHTEYRKPPSLETLEKEFVGGRAPDARKSKGSA